MPGVSMILLKATARRPFEGEAVITAKRSKKKKKMRTEKNVC